MTRRFAMALLGLFVAGFLAAAEPRWTPLGPPAAPQYARLYQDPTDARRQFALTEAGLWRSANAGVSWRLLQNGLAGQVTAVALDPAHPGRLYAIVSRYGLETTIRRSDDAGDHWSTLFTQAYDDAFFGHELLIDPAAEGTLYWKAREFLEISRDGGRTWHCYVGSGCQIDVVNTARAAALPPDRPGTIYVVDVNHNFHRTTDGGGTWASSFIPDLAGPPDVFVATGAPHTLYAWSRDPFYRGDIEPCFVRSDDEGETWKPILWDTGCGMPAVDPEEPRTVRMVVVDGGVPQIWISRDGGDHWSTAGTAPYLGDLYALAQGRLALVSSGKGISEAVDVTGPWRPSNRGFMASRIASVLPTEHGLLAAPSLQVDGIEPPAFPLLETRDGGRSWHGLPLVDAEALAADPSDPNHLIASAQRYDRDHSRHFRVLESRDAGATWKGVVDPATDPPELQTLAVDPFDPRTFYGGTRYQGFCRSVDGGRTWQSSNAGLRPWGGCTNHSCSTNSVWTVLTDPGQAGHLIIHFNNQVFESVDGGDNWLPRSPALPRYGHLSFLARDPQGGLVALGSGVRPGDGESLGVIYRSANGGRSWRRGGRLPGDPAHGDLTGLVATRAGLFVSTDSLGVLWSADGGATWKPLNDGLPSLWIRSLTADPFDPARLYAATWTNGVYAIRVP